MNKKSYFRKYTLAFSVSIAVTALLTVPETVNFSNFSLISDVQAAPDNGGGQGGGQGSKGGQRGGGQGSKSGQRGGGHDSGHDTDHTDDGGHTDHDSGHDTDLTVSDSNSSGSEGRRGKSGVQGSARGGESIDQVLQGGGKPWAREGIPEVELGRLNVSRAPAHVLARAEQEALANYSNEMGNLYNLTAEAAAVLLESQYFELVRIDSPLQNLALYKNVMMTGDSKLPGVQPAGQMDLAAIFLGSASDKTTPISADTVSALNTILGITGLSQENQVILATKAETVRSAILIGHGEVTH